MPQPRRYAVPPSAARLTGSLRDIGYDFPTALADIVDNSVAAGARTVEIDLDADGPDGPRIAVSDDGCGMSANGVLEALRFGSRRTYRRNELGRYGLGLKTASLSQARCVTVVSRRPPNHRIAVRRLSLDVIEKCDDWLIIHPGACGAVEYARARMEGGMNTVVIWEDLDRAVPTSRRTGGGVQRRMSQLTGRAAAHLSMVFHRHLAADDGLVITVNGQKLSAWDPFSTGEPATTELPPVSFELSTDAGPGKVRLHRWILPARNGYSSAAAFEEAAGPLKWNRQQGLYVYRAGRLVQWGGWAGIRAIDEHTKLARAALDFDTDLDDAFNIDVAKMRVGMPSRLRQMLDRPVTELCLEADAVYRAAAGTGSPDEVPAVRGAPADASGAGLALLSAAAQTGHYDALVDIVRLLRQQSPETVDMLGLVGL